MGFEYTVVKQPMTVSLEALSTVLSTSQAAGNPFPRTEHITKAVQTSNWRATVEYAVNVTNTGGRDADDVVLGFLTPPGAGKNGVPLKQLFGFERVHVKAGETTTVLLYPSHTDFAQVNIDGQFKVLPGEYKAHFGVQETAPHGMGYVQAGRVTAAIPSTYI